MIKKYIFIGISLFVLLTILFAFRGKANSWEASNKTEFKVFDAIGFSGKPNLTKYGFSKINLIYEDDLLSDNYFYPNNRKSKVINRHKLTKVKQLVKLDFDVPVCLDVEAWPRTKPFIKQSNSKYRDLMSLFLLNNEEVTQVGFFANSVAAKNVLFPSFYASSTDESAWKTQAEMRMKSFRKQFPHLKIYAFIWPQYNHNGLSNKPIRFIESKFWRLQLETMYKYADGVVIWAPVSKIAGSVPFSYNMPWFQETLKFIKDHHIH